MFHIVRRKGFTKFSLFMFAWLLHVPYPLTQKEGQKIPSLQVEFKYSTSTLNKTFLNNIMINLPLTHECYWSFSSQLYRDYIDGYEIARYSGTVFKKNLSAISLFNKDKTFCNSSHQKIQPDVSYESWLNELCSLHSLKHVIWSRSVSNSFSISISKQLLFKNTPTDVYLYNLSFSRALVWWSKRCNCNSKVSRNWQNITFDHVWWVH